jgi:hypothetical protein
MSFSAREKSAANATPVNLYLFEYGTLTTSIYCYTDAEEPIELPHPTSGSPLVFLPIPISRSNIHSSGSADNSAVTVEMPKNTDFANLFTVYPPSGVVFLTLFMGHPEDGEYRIIWSGKVLSRAIEKEMAKFRCDHAVSSLSRNILRRNWQYSCAHPLYLSPCNANKAAATATVAAQVVAVESVQLAAGWRTKAAADYLGGLVSWTAGETETRTIVDVESGPSGSDILVLGGLTSRLIAGAPVQVSLGCKRTVADCSALHNNIRNFGGFNYIPTSNPFEGKVQ